VEVSPTPALFRRLAAPRLAFRRAAADRDKSTGNEKEGLLLPPREAEAFCLYRIGGTMRGSSA
jgi:hypothetical protein